MDQGGSSATHETPPNNNENNENDDWERIGDSSNDLLLSYREMMSNMSKADLEKYVMERTVRDCNGSRSPFSVPAHLPPSGPPLDSLAHTCHSCASNGGPSYYQPIHQQQHPSMPTSGPYINSSGGLSYPYPLGSSTYSTTSSPHAHPFIPSPPLSHSTQQSSIQSLITNPLYYWGSELTRLLQIQAAMAKPSLVSLSHNQRENQSLAPSTETQGNEGLTDHSLRMTTASNDETTNSEFVNSFMRNLLGQFTESLGVSQSKTWNTQTGTLAGIPSVPSIPTSTSPIPPPSIPPSTSPSTSQSAPLPFSVSTQQTQCPDISFFMQYLKKQFESHEYAVFRDLERKVIIAYGGKYLRQSVPPTSPPSLPPPLPSSLPSSLRSTTEYAHPGGTIPCVNGIDKSDNGMGSSPVSPSLSSSLPSSPSSSQPFNPLSSTTEKDKALAEALIYAQTRWPHGTSDGECAPLTAEDMPSCVSYDHFTQLLPTFLSRFGEPLASFLTVLSCLNRDERMRKRGERSTQTQSNMMMKRDNVIDVFNFEKILWEEFHSPSDFTNAQDEKMLRVLRDAINDIMNEDGDGEKDGEGRTRTETETVSKEGGMSGRRASLPSLPSVPPLSALSALDSFSPEAMGVVDAFYTKHALNGEPLAPGVLPSILSTPLAHLNYTCLIPPSPFPPFPPFPPIQTPSTAASQNGGLMTMSDEELRDMLLKESPRLELSEEMEMILRAMERAGVTPPQYSSPHDLINKLILYQYHYGVEAVPSPQPPIVAINPHNGLPMTVEEVNRQLMTPPELMLLFPQSRKYPYHCSNAMITDFRKKKRIEVLELSDDEESDEAGGLHSLPVSIKREYVLGVGSFGTVYEGCVVPLEKTHPKEVDLESDDKKVAIKAINMSYFSTYPYLKKQLDYEVSTLRQCMGFPSIVQFEGFTESPFNTVSPSQHAFIVMELMGCNLEDYVKKQDPTRLSELHAKVIMRQIQTALHFLHCRGISHCDLKPSNILLHEKSTTLPHVKLSDFGHVRYYGEMITETEIAEQTGGLGVANNRGYRAPEHATAQGFSPELDMYALGAVSYFIMSGFVPNLTAPRNPAANQQTLVMNRTRKGKKGKKIEETIELPRMPSPSVASMVPGCVLSRLDERMLPEEHMFDLVEEPHLWPYTSKLSYHFCKEHMRIDPHRRISLVDSMNHEWLSGFEMYSMLRRLECKMGLFKPSERHLTTVRDDVFYHRSMLHMASNPSFIPPFSSLSGGGDQSNGSTALLNMYAREGDYSYLYGPVIRDPPQMTPLSHDSSLTVRSAPIIPPPSIPHSVHSVSPLPPLPIPLNEPVYGKKTNGKIKKKAK